MSGASCTLVPLRRVARIVNGGTPGPAERFWGGNIPWATPVDLNKVDGGWLTATDRTITDDGLADGSTLIPAQSVVISSRAPIGYIANSAVPIAFNQGCKGIVPITHNTNARFLLYALQSQIDYLKTLGQGSTFLEVGTSQVASLKIPWTNPATQFRIADYLDHETAELDQFVNLHSRFRKLLRERRSNTVKARVTRGLSVDAELRLSRDPSIGDYPATWRETRLKFIGKSIIGVTYSPEGLVDESHDGVNVLRSGNIQNGHLVSADMVRISQPVPTNLRIREGDILLCARNGSADLVGKNALASKDFFGDTWGAFMVVFRSPHFRFLSWFFNTDTFKSRIGGFSTTTINQLTSKDLGNSLIALPPEAEQAQISNLLDQETAVIDDLITDSALATALARERRAALITAAVTGQIDVTARHKPVAEQLEDDIAQGLHREN